MIQLKTTAESTKAYAEKMKPETKELDGVTYGKYRLAYMMEDDKYKAVLSMNQPTHYVVHVSETEIHDEDGDSQTADCVAGSRDEVYEFDATSFLNAIRGYSETEITLTAHDGKMSIMSEEQRSAIGAKLRREPIYVPQCQDDGIIIAGRLRDTLHPAVLLATASGKNAGAKTKTIHISIDDGDLVVEGVSANGVVSTRAEGAYVAPDGQPAPFSHIAIPLAGAKNLLTINSASGCDTSIGYDEGMHLLTVACQPFVGEYKCEEVVECHIPEVDESYGIVGSHKALLRAVSKAKAVDGNSVTLQTEGSTLHVCAPEEKFHTQMDVCVSGPAKDFTVSLPMSTFHAILRGMVSESIEMYFDEGKGLVELLGGNVRAVVNMI